MPSREPSPTAAHVVSARDAAGAAAPAGPCSPWSRAWRRCRCAARPSRPRIARTSVFTPRYPMLNGSWTTMRVELAVAQRLQQLVGAVEADEPDLAGEVRVLQRAQHPERRRLVRDRRSRATPPSRRSERGQQVLARLEPALDRGAAVLVRADDRDAGRARERRRGTPARARVVLAEPSWSRSMMTLPLPPRRLRQVVAGQPAAGVVVGLDEAEVVGAVELRVEDDDRDAGAHRVGDRPAQRLVVERREQDAGDAPGRESCRRP